MLNLQIVLVIFGAIVVLMIYLFSRWQNQTNRQSKKTTGTRGRAFRKDAPALGGFDADGDQAEMSALDTPDYSGEEADLPDSEAPENRRIFSAPGFSGDDEAAGENSGEDALPEKSFSGDSAADAMPGDAERYDLATAAPAGGWPEGRTDDSRAPVFGKQAGGLHNHSIDGFEQLSQIDYWVRITGERDVGRESVLAIYRDAAIDFTKTHSIYGRKVSEKRWYNLENEAEGTRFDDLVLTIQLTDCNGAISEGEMARFSALVLRLSEGTGREFVFMTTVENALAQGRRPGRVRRTFRFPVRDQHPPARRPALSRHAHRPLRPPDRPGKGRQPVLFPVKIGRQGQGKVVQPGKHEAIPAGFISRI